MALSKQADDIIPEMTSAKSVREDAALLLAPYMSFEEFLIPAPISICALSELMLVATTETDIALSRSLVPVVNDGYRALNTAHTNMDKIRLQTTQTPNHLRSVLNILLKGSLYDISDMLPIELNATKHSAEDCLRYAKETEEAFDLVTAELQECYFSTPGHIDRLLWKTCPMYYKKGDLWGEGRRESTSQQIEGLRVDKAMNDKIRLKLEEAMNRAEEDYRKTLDEMPSAWNLIGMQELENASNVVSGVLNCVIRALPAKLMARSSAVGTDLTGTDLTIFEHLVGPVQPEQSKSLYFMDRELITCVYATRVQSKAEYLFTTFVDKDSTLNSSQFNEDAKSKLAHCMEVFHTTRAELSKCGDEFAGEVTKLCSSWYTVYSELKTVVETKKMDVVTGQDIASRMTQLHTDTVKFGSQAQATMKNSQFETRLPFQEKARAIQGNKDEKFAKELAAEGAKVKLAQMSETLKHTRENYDKVCARAQETRKELREFRAKTTKLQMKKMEFETIKEILKEGILTFAKLRDQWSKLFQFFKMTSNIIDVCLNKSVKKLVDEVEVSAERSKSVAGFEQITGLQPSDPAG